MKNMSKAPLADDFFHLKFDKTIPNSCTPPKHYNKEFHVPFSTKNGDVYKAVTITSLIAVYTCCILYIYYKKNAYTSTKA